MICDDGASPEGERTEEAQDRMRTLQESLCMKRLIEYIRSAAIGSPDEEARTRAEFLVFTKEMAGLITPNDSLSADLNDLNTVVASTTRPDGTNLVFGNLDENAVAKLKTAKVRMEEKEHRFHKPI